MKLASNLLTIYPQKDRLEAGMVLSSAGYKVPWALRGGCGVVGANFARLRNSNCFWLLPFLRLCFVAPPLKTEPAGAGLRFWRGNARAYAGDMERFSLHIPGAGSLDLRLPCAGRPRRGLPAASLGSTASVVRAMGLREKVFCPCFQIL